MVKRIICLANSRKLSGRCLAGRVVGPNNKIGGWIRPVSPRPDQAVSEYERQYADGGDPQVQDVVDVPVLEPHPSTYQQENWVIDSDETWVKVRRAEWQEVAALAEGGALWLNDWSTYNGVRDRIPSAEADKLTTSLKLIRVPSLVLSVFSPGEAFGNSKRRVQARFSHAGSDYGFWVTDPRYERAYLAQADGDYELKECCLTISLSEPLNGFAYKLVAAVIPKKDGI